MPETDQRGPQENMDQQVSHGQISRGLDGADNLQESSRLDGTSENGRGRGQGSSNRGFAAMNPNKQKEIASEGGRAAHRQGVAHEWTSEEARMAGRKGGQTVSQNREHMSEIGRRGGQSSGGRRNRNQQSEGGNRE
ncbi:MAG TPA: KGG domain-containing protein [Flavisolibacter sp.]|nr:KGG domain-containing protein [Flavisolibacter sp.]